MWKEIRLKEQNYGLANLVEIIYGKIGINCEGFSFF